MKILKIIGFIDAIFLVLLGILYFMDIRFDMSIYSILLIMLIISASIQKIKKEE